MAIFQNVAYFSADSVTSNKIVSTFANQSSTLALNLVVNKDGTLLLDGKKISERVNILKNMDEIRFPILDNAGTYYDAVTVTVTLPSDFANSVTPSIDGIHGVGSSSAEIEDSHTIVYSASQVDSAATVSIIAEMPKGSIKPPFLVQIFSQLNNLKSNFWIILAVMVPALTLLFMFALIAYELRRNKTDQPKFESNTPPMAIPPALVGVLFHQKVGPREIAATLIDLAMRGDIIILDRERDFAFAKNKFDQRLLPYEKILLSKIFDKNISSSASEIEERINRHMYSKKISLFSSGVYALSTQLGYFKQNPQQVHSKYTTAGVLMFFAGVVGFFLSLAVFTNPPYAALFWVGMMVASLVIVYISYKIPIRSVLGQETSANWVAFRNFLTNKNRIEFSYENQNLFQKYLPYALVLDCEVAWAKRFSGQNFVLPDWYATNSSGLGLEDFCLSLFPIVSYVSRSLASTREPGFD